MVKSDYKSIFDNDKEDTQTPTSRIRPREDAEYGAVPAREEYKGTDFGYGAKRYLGGPIARTLEAVSMQQYIYGMAAGAQNRLPDDWNMGSPWARIIYPSRYPRIREAAVTGTENPFINLGVGLATDPMMYFGGAATKLGKANKLIRGLEHVVPMRLADLSNDTRKFLDAADDVRGALKLANKAGGKKAVGTMIQDIIGKEGKMKSFEPIIKGIDKYGDSVFDPAYKMSEQIRMGRRNVLGVGVGSGLGKPTDLDVMGKFREPAARAWERYEFMKQGMKQSVGMTRFQNKPQAIEKIKDLTDFAEPQIFKITKDAFVEKADDFTNKGYFYAPPTHKDVATKDGLVVAFISGTPEAPKIGLTDAFFSLGMKNRKHILRHEYAHFVTRGLPDSFKETVALKHSKLIEKIIKTNRAYDADEFITDVIAGKSFEKLKIPRDELSKYTSQIKEYEGIVKHLEAGSEPVILSEFVQRSKIPQFEELTREMLEAVGWTAAKEATRLGRMAVKDITSLVYQHATDPQTAKLTSRAFANAIQGNIDKYPEPAARQAAEAYYNLMTNIVYGGEKKFKEFDQLPLYIPRQLASNMKGKTLPREWLTHMTDPIDKIAKRLGSNFYSKLRSIRGGDDFVTVTSGAHRGRATEKWTSIEDAAYYADEAIRMAKEKGDLGLANELAQAKKPITKIQKILATGLDKEMSPHAINEMLRNGVKGADGNVVAEGVGDYMETFMKSKAGRNLGYKKGMTADDFNFFEEDFRKILPDRIVKHTHTMSSGKTLTKFLGRFGFMKDSIARARAIKEGNPSKIVDELGMAQALSEEKGGRIVNVAKHLEKQMGITDQSLKSILGKVVGGNIDDLYMDVEAADAFGHLLKAWEKLPADAPMFKKFQKATQYWAHMTLFGGRSSYVFNNLVGDRWNMYLAGATHPKHMSGSLAMQVMLPKGKTFAGLPGVKGLADDATVFVSKNGISWTKQQVLDAIMQFDIDGGLFGSPLFETMDKAFYKGVPASKEMFERLSKGGLTAPAQYMAQMTEKNGRYSLFMHFLEEGYHPSEASQKVAQYLFDYSKQNKYIRGAMPFYWWTANNVPLQFANMWKQPGKIKLPTHVQWAMESRGGDPTEDAKPDYLRATGVYYGEHNDKDIYIDLSNIPAYAAQEALGFMDTEGSFDAMFREAAKRGVIMTSPFLQLGIELATGRDLFTGQKFVGGSPGVMSEKGTQEFLGISIQGDSALQTGSQIVKTLFTPTDIADMMIKMAKDPSKRMPAELAIPRFVLGAPVRQVVGTSAEYINTSRELNHNRDLMDKYQKLGDTRNYNKYRVKVKVLQNKMNLLNKKRQIEKKGK